LPLQAETLKPPLDDVLDDVLDEVLPEDAPLEELSPNRFRIICSLLFGPRLKTNLLRVRPGAAHAERDLLPAIGRITDVDRNLFRAAAAAAVA
jgi:hypothetical protein